MLNRFVIDDKVGTLVDQLDELSTIHFSDSVDFFELYEFLNRQESRIDRYKSYVNDPFKEINDDLRKILGVNFEEFVAKYNVRFYEFSQDLSITNDIDHYYSIDSPNYAIAIPKRRMGEIVLRGNFMM